MFPPSESEKKPGRGPVALEGVALSAQHLDIALQKSRSGLGMLGMGGWCQDWTVMDSYFNVIFLQKFLPILENLIYLSTILFFFRTLRDWCATICRFLEYHDLYVGAHLRISHAVYRWFSCELHWDCWGAWQVELYTVYIYTFEIIRIWSSWKSYIYLGKFYHDRNLRPHWNHG